MRKYIQTKLSLVGLSLAMCVPCMGAGDLPDLTWPSEWTVFAPLSRADRLVEGFDYGVVPSVVETVATASQSAQRFTGVRIEVDGGEVMDLEGLFEEQAVGNTALIFLEIESPREQEVYFGIGADWWVEVWLNGEPVFDTLQRGNQTGHVGVSNHRFAASLTEGTNILAVRFATGLTTSLIAIGGPAEIAADQQRIIERQKLLRLNKLPENFEDRLIFPVDVQAVATAEMQVDFPHTDKDLASGALVGVASMPQRQLYYHNVRGTRGEMLDTDDRRFDKPVTLLVSKCRYPWEDQHLDAIVWTTTKQVGAAPSGHVVLQVKDRDGAVLVEQTLDDLAAPGVFFSLGFTPAMAGSELTLEAEWVDGDTVLGSTAVDFLVEAPVEVATSGRIPLAILNEPGVTLNNAPMTLGVPFPRGALSDPLQTRLVDESGREIPLQTRVTAKWSRFGTVRWLLCDFTVDLEGEPRTVYLEYGPEVSRMAAKDIAVADSTEGFPALDAGRIRVSSAGLQFDAAADGKFVNVLGVEALTGAFVEHENGKVYRVASDITHAVEELGSEKAVIRRTGWYADAASGERFCQFVTRFVFHRNSPVVRVFHTWIFTGDGNRDRIASMGWDFPTAKKPTTGSILIDSSTHSWIDAPVSLVQFNFEDYLLVGSPDEHPGRTPGVVHLALPDSGLAFGVKDFWQNFPSEIDVNEDGFRFLNWPRNNPAERFERPVAPGHAYRSRFVHEGTLLDFRLPEEYASGDIWRQSSSREGHIARGRPESVNAQGIARTEEMFLYLTPPDTSRDTAAAVIRGLDDESIRAVVDPFWLAASGVFGPIHPRDVENFPEHEAIYEDVMLSTGRWGDRLDFYGMWVFGDQPTWSMDLHERTVDVYRALRKHHRQYPVRSLAFARSGDPRLLKLAERAVKQNTDANFCHFATADVDAIVGPTHFRRQGWWDRSFLPWAGRYGPFGRNYTGDSDYLWDFYYLTGYGRARDVALLFGEVAKNSHEVANMSNAGFSRVTQSMLTSYMDMYQATFDPWFLNALHEVARGHERLYGGLDPVDTMHQQPNDTGHTWRRTDQRMYDFGGCELHRHMALNNATAWISPASAGARTDSTDGWGLTRGYQAAFAWRLTGDPFFLARAVASLDLALIRIYQGDVEYLRGTSPHIGHGGDPTGMALSMPHVLYAVANADSVPDPLHDQTMISGHWVEREDDSAYHFQLPDAFVMKTGAEPVSLFLDARGRGRRERPEPYQFSIQGPDGFQFSGEWNAPETIEIPADAPVGKYRVHISGIVPYPPDHEDHARFRRQHGTISYPLTNYDVPEVMLFSRTTGGTRVPSGSTGQWFLVPEGTTEFWIEFQTTAGRSRVNRVGVWDPNGERAWDLSFEGDAPERVTITVPEGQDGQLWRATGGNFAIDPQIPPVFSSTRGKWFDVRE